MIRKRWIVSLAEANLQATIASARNDPAKRRMTAEEHVTLQRFGGPYMVVVVYGVEMQVLLLVAGRIE